MYLLITGRNWNPLSILTPKKSIIEKALNKRGKSNLPEGLKSTFIGIWWINFIATQTPIQIGTKVKRTKSKFKGVRPKPFEKEQMGILEQKMPNRNEPRM